MSVRTLWLAVFIMLVPAGASAHRPSDSFLQLQIQDGTVVQASWDIALQDLDEAFQLDDGDGALRWGELRDHEPQIRADLRATLVLSRGPDRCDGEVDALALVEHSDGSYARFHLTYHCWSRGPLQLAYTFLHNVDASHRALLSVRDQHGSEAHQVLRADGSNVTLSTGAAKHSSLGTFLQRGVMHILEGLDHVLFLLVLLLPSVLRTVAGKHQPVQKLSSTLWTVLRVVTAFTVAHSVTLSLSALGVARAASAVIEPAIAASVLLAALANLLPILPEQRWAPAFALGLLHGFGLSSALTEAGLSGANLTAALLAFNVGVELGQLAIVVLLVPLLFLLRNRALYQPVVLRAGSSVVCALSLFWLIERVL